MQDVRSTVTESMRSNGMSSYLAHAEPVITTLENRERDICGVLIEYATQQGLSRENAQQALAHAGLAVGQAAPTPSAFPSAQPHPESFAPSNAPQDEILAAVRQMQETVAGLVDFARQNGYRG